MINCDVCHAAAKRYRIAISIEPGTPSPPPPKRVQTQVSGGASNNIITVSQDDTNTGHAALGSYVWTITDSDGNAVSQAGDTVKLSVYAPTDQDTELWTVTGAVICKLQPGDTIVVRHPGHMRKDSYERLKGQMQETFPEQRVVVLEDDMSLEVYQQEESGK